MNNFKKKVAATLAVTLLGGLFIGSPVQAEPVQAKPLSKEEVLPKDLPNVTAKPGKDTSKRLIAPKGMPVKDGVGTKVLTNCDPACYKYAGFGQFFADAAEGIGADISISNPYIAQPGNNATDQNAAHTLMEVAAISNGTTDRNIVEVGWTRDLQVCGFVNTPCLFSFLWIDGDEVCYNLCALGNFQDLSGNAGYSPVGPGDSLSSYVGTTKNFKVRYLTNAQSGNRQGWWLGFDDLWIGYYEDDHWVNAGETFTGTYDPQIFGEIASYTFESCTDMGSGAMAGTSPSTVITDYTAPGTTDTLDMDEWVIATDSTKWGRTSSGTPVNMVRVGGPGSSSDGDSLGDTGSCAPATPGTASAATFQFWEQGCPDGQNTTGCDAGTAYNTGSAPLNVCTAVPAGFEAQAYKNNSGVSGRTYYLYRSPCTGSTIGVGNAVQALLPDDWDGTVITHVKRVG